MASDYEPDFDEEFGDDPDDDPDATARLSVVEIVDSAMLEDFLDRVEDFRREHPEARRMDPELAQRMGVLPLAYIPREGREALCAPKSGGEPARMVSLSPATAFRQAVRHPEITADDYRRAPDLIWDGAIELRGGGDELAFYEVYGEDWWQAVVRQAPDGSLTLQSLHTIERRDLPDAVHAATLLDSDLEDPDDPEIRDALEALSRMSGVVALSEHTMRKQQVRHPELTTDEYRLLPELIANGDIEVAPRRRRISFYGHFDGHWYKAVVAETTMGRLYLIGFHRCAARHTRRAHPQKPAEE